MDGVALKSGEGMLQGVFVNEYTHSVDAKGRFAIPTEWRGMLQGDPKRIVVLPSFHKDCLDVYPVGAFEHRLKKFMDMAANDEKGREFARILGSRSDLAALDNQGRVRIKEPLFEFAGLSRQVVLVGAFDRFEIWSPEAWAKDHEDHGKEYLRNAAEEFDF